VALDGEIASGISADMSAKDEGWLRIQLQLSSFVQQIPNCSVVLPVGQDAAGLGAINCHM
jgi:hypothetical protein